MNKIIPTSRRPDITFCSSGEIYITARVARILDLTPHSCINIAVHKGEWLLFAVHYPAIVGRHVARCHAVNAGSLYFRANSVRLCRAMLQACGVTGRAALMCGEAVMINGKPHLPVITRTTL